MDIFGQISESLQAGDDERDVMLVRQAIDTGIAAQDILDKGLLAGMNIVGEQFKNNEVYVPEVLVAADAMNKGIELLKPLLGDDGIRTAGKVAIGPVSGDLHDIGKNLVKLMMEGKGLVVVDLGTDVSPLRYVEAAIQEGCTIIACSALLTTTMSVMEQVVEEAEKAGIRGKVKIMVGGAPVTEAFCKKIGADFYAADASTAAETAVKICAAQAQENG